MSKNIQNPLTNDKCVLILGMHRSGTSVLSHAIDILGADLGDTLLKASKDNQKGYFENKRFLDLNNEILHSIGCTWDNLIVPTLIPDSEIYTDKISNAIITEFTGSNFYSIKDPRIIRIKDLWVNAFRKLEITPYFIISNRHPFEVARSLLKRNAIPKKTSLLLWITHQIDGLLLVLNNNGLVITYDNFLRDPHSTIHNIAHYLNIPTSNKDKDIANFCHDFIDNKLKHNTADHSKTASNNIERLSLELYTSTTSYSENKTDLSLQNLLSAINNCKDFLATNQEKIMEMQADFIEQKEAVSFLSTKLQKTIAMHEAQNKKLRSELRWIQSKPLIRFKNTINRLVCRKS